MSLNYPISLLIRALKEINKQYKKNQKTAKEAWEGHVITKDDVLEDMRDKRKEVKKAIQVLSKYQEDGNVKT